MTPDWFPQDIQDRSKYQDFTRIASGRWAEVYRVQFNDQIIALKCLKSDHAAHLHHREFFLNEVKILQKVSHPCIPKYLGHHFSEKICFLKMEYIAGLSLLQVISAYKKRSFPLFFEWNFSVMLKALRVLQDLHAMGWVHRDVKPGNLLVTNSLEVFLIDLSMACLSGEPQEKFSGTIRYAPPEVLAGDPPNEQTDFFALVLTFYEMWSGESLLKGNFYQKFSQLVSGEYVKKICAAKFPKPLEDFFLKGSAFKVQDRFKNAQDFEKALRQCIEKLGLTLDPEKLKKQFEQISKIT